MAKKSTKTAHKAANPPQNSTNRHQLVFDETTTNHAEELAKQDLRSFNNLMAWLIDQEWKRRQLASAA